MFGLHRFTVTGCSMEPTLSPGDAVVVSTHTKPGVGDIVICRDPRTQERIIKRIIAKQGDRYTVQGDTLSESTDSRSFGPLSSTDILGKVIAH